jgi:hypothetical protein
MRTLFTILSLLPAPSFVVLGSISWYTGSSMCSHFHWIIPEMVLMWYLMALAHLLPWFMWWEQRKHRRFSQIQKTLPVKQQ